MRYPRIDAKGCFLAVGLPFTALLIGLVFAKSSVADDASLTQERMILVVGAGGEDEYADQFADSASRWVQMANERGINIQRIGPDSKNSDFEFLPESLSDKQKLLDAISNASEKSEDTLWIVMLGHGTFQQGVANFNLQGPDISADDIAKVLETVQRPLVVVSAFSASGPWLGKLSKPNRIIITATRSGDEQNYSRFSGFLSHAICSPEADLDHDLNVSVLEAFLKSAEDTKKFYETEGRLQTEHSLLDDNGDQLGTPPGFFRGVRVVQATSNDAEPDGQLARTVLLSRSEQLPILTAEQRMRIAEIESQIQELRDKKSELSEDDYFTALEPLLVQLASIELQSQKSD